MDLAARERELKRVSARFNYMHLERQRDDWDGLTSFIYDIDRFDVLDETIDLHLLLHGDYKKLRAYAVARWYYYQSSTAVEWMFCQHPGVAPEPTGRDRDYDLTIGGDRFDIKLTRLPKEHSDPVTALANRREVIRWYYLNQTNGSRYGCNSRIIVAPYGLGDEQWKLRSELDWLKSNIDEYMLQYDSAHLEISHKVAGVKADLIVPVWK